MTKRSKRASHLAFAKRRDVDIRGKGTTMRRFSDESLTLVAVDASGKQTDGWTDWEKEREREKGEEIVKERKRER